MNENLANLSALLAEKQDQIIANWKAVACRLPGTQHLDEPLLLDHMPQLIYELSTALTNAHSISILEMKAQKSAEEHGAIRFRLGFDIEQVVAEFGLLRDVLQQFAEENRVDISGEVNITVNRVLDKAVAGSLKTYIRQQADDVERKRREYLSFIVHDLKTPISAIVTATSVIDESLSNESEATAITKKMLDIVRRNADGLNGRIMKIINDENRLQALTGEAQEVELDIREIDLWPMAEILMDDRQFLASSRGNTIRNEIPHDLRICADSELLLELLRNLLGNALKYTTAGEIIFGATERTDSVVCWVQDTGAGIPAERINQIFDKGTRDPDVPESTGLGLAIVAKIMQLHGGRASVESTAGAGTTFRMEFPKKRCKAA